METSAYHSINIDSAFQIMIEGTLALFILEIFIRFHKQLEDTPDEFNLNDHDRGVDLNSSPPEKKKSCC